MNPALRLIRHQWIPKFYRVLCATGVAGIAVLIAGCGGGGSTTTSATGYTLVTVLASSTGNDLISAYTVPITNLTLTDKDGKSVLVINAPESAEYIHVNGSAEPLLTNISVPQDTYVSATATIGMPWGVCTGLTSTGGALTAEFSSGTPAATVNLPGPILVTGTAMGLMLNLQVSQSVNFSSCDQNTTQNAKLTPVFDLTAITVASQPSNLANGKMVGLYGLISSLDGNGVGFNVSSGDGRNWHVNTNSSTVFEGVNGLAQLSVGIPVDMDAALRLDGSMEATRVAGYNITASNLTLLTGPLMYASPNYSRLYNLFTQTQGSLDTSMDGDITYPNATFQISSQLTNLNTLPFTAIFSSASMVAGQNVWTSTYTTDYNSPNYISANTITLVPQTINGTVSAVASSGGFTVYTVTLAPYDGFPLFASEVSGFSPLSNPSIVEVYVDGSAQLLNSSGSELTVGSLGRFNGLIFNDNGALRMDCALVSDGVAE
jgi:hypothetical protein